MKPLQILIIPIVLLFTASALAGPFGLSMGMTKEQIGGDLKEVEQYWYETPSVPSPSSYFKSYRLFIDKNLGLAKIVARTEAIKTNIYGTELKRRFQEMENLLLKKYGTNEKADYLRPGSIWNKPKDWMTALEKEERDLVAFWTKESGASLLDDLEGISLMAIALDSNHGLLFIEYEFSNFEECLKRIKAAEADSL